MLIYINDLMLNTFFIILAKLITFQHLSLILAQESLTTDKLLKTLPQAGMLIRGCWTARSEVLYPPDTRSGSSGVPAELMCRGRDYVVGNFSMVL